MFKGKWIATLVIVSLVAAAMPTSVWAEESVSTAGQGSTTLRASVEAAGARLAAQRSPLQSPATHAAAMSSGQAPMGGGGGKGMMIMTLVTTVVGVGATYYMIKQMQKQTQQPGE